MGLDVTRLAITGTAVGIAGFARRAERGGDVRADTAGIALLIGAVSLATIGLTAVDSKSDMVTFTTAASGGIIGTSMMTLIGRIGVAGRPVEFPKLRVFLAGVYIASFIGSTVLHSNGGWPLSMTMFGISEMASCVTQLYFQYENQLHHT